MNVDRESEEALMNRIMWRVMPLVMAMMMLAVIDRSNVGYAKLQMASSLGMKP